MSHQIHPAGPAFAEALRLMTELDRSETPYRTVDLINIGRHCADTSHAVLLHDPVVARKLLIRGASRMLAAASRLADAPEVTPLVRRPNLRVIR